MWLRLIGAGLSKPHTSVTSLHTCVCLLGACSCLDWPLTVSDFRLLFWVFCVVQNFKKGLKVGSWIQEPPSQWQQQWWRPLMDLCTYSVARATEVTAWQSFNAICHCCLIHGSCHWTLISSGYSDGDCLQRMSIMLARLLLSVLAISVSLAACAGPSCVQHALARPDSQFLCCTRV